MRRFASIGAVIGVSGLVLFSAAPAGAGGVPAGKGDITGKVRAAAGGGILAGKCVYADDLAGHIYDGVRPTTANGAYRIRNVPVGDYTVVVWNCDGSQYQPQVWKGHDGLVAGDPVHVTAGQTTAGVSFKMRPAGSVHVTVTDPDGDPLPNVLVFNTYRGNFSSTCFGGITAGDGEVTNNGVPPVETTERIIDLNGVYDEVDVDIEVPVGTTLELPVQMGTAVTPI
jgi:hypothetical protein